jgi:hypothetical protein
MRAFLISICRASRDNKEIELTRGRSLLKPRWSPGRRAHAFVSSRARAKAKPDTAPMQIWLINPHGGGTLGIDGIGAPRQIDLLTRKRLSTAPKKIRLYEQELRKRRTIRKSSMTPSTPLRCDCTRSA